MTDILEMVEDLKQVEKEEQIKQDRVLVHDLMPKKKLISPYTISREGYPSRMSIPSLRSDAGGHSFPHLLSPAEPQILI
jgi:hypothetical protein